MIEATCGACGTVARIAEADVPAGAKFVSCASCKARVPLPQAAGAKPPPRPSALPPLPKTPPPIPGPAMSNKPTVDLGADLPAPKPRGSAPASRSALSDADLPAPKAAKPAAASALDLDDLMGGADLPAPKAKSDAGMADLPAPKPRASALGDAPPSKPAPSPLADLPAPKAKPSALADLPAPKAKAGLADLPAPKAKGGRDLDGGLDLPAPKDALDLPAPKDAMGLPMPKPGANNDLPAPKGFFDDLPQPAKKGSSDLPAPKGFFDDLPQPAKKGGGADLPAPKGFFDDLPQPKPDGGGGGGFFDDLPQPKAEATGGGFFDDLPQPSKAKPIGGPDSLSLDDGGLDLSSPPGGPPGALDLGLPPVPDGGFTDLDLASPVAGVKPPTPAAPPDDEPGSPIKIKTPAKGSKPATPIPIVVKKDSPADLKLDLADDPHGGAPAAVSTAAKPTPKKKSNELSPEERAAKKRRSRMLAGAAIGVALLGGGGFYMYQRHAAQQERAETIESQLAEARKQLNEAGPMHWQKAATAAQKVLEVAPNHSAALGLAAEATLAGALDNGKNFAARVAQGRKLVQDGLGAGKSSPELERAQAVMTIAANQPDRAIPLLQKQLAKSPKDGWLHLYMGWAQLAKGDADEAIKSFDAAVAATPAAKLPALYAHGKAKLLKADIEGARAAFASVLQSDKDHIGAQVGLAATLPPQQSAQREADLLGVLARSDIKDADPRAVVQAWTMVGDIARNTGRLDLARDHYRKALGLSALDVPALNGLTAVEIKDNKIQVASDLNQKALTADATNAEAQLLAAQLDILQGRLPDADGKLKALFEHKPPLPPLLLARVHVIKGQWLEAQGGKDEEAIAEYQKGAKLAGDLDLAPTMAAVKKLTFLTRTEPDEAKASSYRLRANEILASLAARAQEDAELSIALGVAYLNAGDEMKAEDNLRRAVTLREKDPEARLQLARALVAQERIDDALAQLDEALLLDPKRTDVALELARTYQVSGRHNQAVLAYEKLLADPNVPTVVRVNAGRYFASRGAFDKAAAQAEPVLKAEPDNPGGLYLKAEGLMLAGKWDEARIVLTRVTDADQGEAQYLDALGRALEGSYVSGGDSKYIEGARYNYERATKADPKMFHPHLGLGRMLVAGRNWDEAIKPLAVASRLDGNNAEVPYYMGVAYFGLRAQDAARKAGAGWFESALKNASALSVEQRADGWWKLGQLYVDLNRLPDAIRAQTAATQAGEQIEKDTGKAPEWLTELYYDLGDNHYKVQNYAEEARAFRRYVDRKPKPGTRLTDAQQKLATRLQNYR